MTPRAASPPARAARVIVALLGILAGRIAVAQSGDVVIQTDTRWSAGSYALDSLTVDGATLSIAGGSTVDVGGEVAIVHGGRIVLEGMNTDAMVDGAWHGTGVRIRAGSMTVAAGAAVTADGQGYVGTAGPGAGASDPSCAGGTAGGGGGHGGAGGVAVPFGAAGGVAYDSPMMPTDLGSGGGNNPSCGATSTANAGGGAIGLEVSGALQLDGAITADAAVASPRLGGGAGGSIYVVAGLLTGTGSFSANGAASGNEAAGGGGGGRIAVYYADAPSFAGFATATVNGGSGAQPNQTGAAGTVAFVDTSVSNGRLHVYQQLELPDDSMLEYDALTLHSGATLRIGGGSVLDVAGEIALQKESTLLLAGKNTTALVLGRWLGQGVTVHADMLTVAAGSSISADGQGYAGTAGPGAGASEPDCAGATAGAGGGHGGAGGDAAFGARGGAAYGLPLAPADLGSGGGNNPSCGATATTNAGGGAIVLTVDNVLQLDGTISADGAGSLAARLGGGAGGSIRVDTHRLTGTGFFSTNGADGGNESAGGGAGGRIAVSYAEAPAFSGFITSRAEGGAGYRPGAPGTVAFLEQSTGAPVLHVFRELVFSADSGLLFDAVTLANGATLRIGGGSTLGVNGELRVSEHSTLVLEGKNRSARVAGDWEGQGVAISAGAVTVESGSTISADGEGYIGTAGPGAGASDPMCAGATAGAGGGHGGTGGDAAFGALGGGAYDSPTAPADLGSGGGNNPGCNETATANAGGGVIDLRVGGVLQLDGTISAAAAGSLTPRLGGGAGGTIRVETNRLTGGGFFSANGADGGSETAGGGAGGRIAVSYVDAPAFSGFITSRAQGGAGHRPGEPGTVAFFERTAGAPILHVFRELVFAADSTLTYDAVTLANGATLQIGGGSTLGVTEELHVSGHSTLVLEGKNRSGRVAGTWQGQGVAINAGAVTIESGSTISADGQGYVGTAGPGAGASDPSCAGATAGAGGGHGGAGGDAAFGALGGAAYDSPTAPADLGSGGGNNPGCNETATANAGGGAIVLNVDGALHLDGTITADAAASDGERLGGGAGGSIHVVTGTVTGAGTFSANGADGGNQAAGGGAGGRIAVYSAAGAAFSGAAASTVAGGTGFAAGDLGTIGFTDTVCDGDCGDNDVVTVNELITAVNIDLGRFGIEKCPAADSDGNGTVTVDDLIRAVNRALGGC